MKKMMSAWDAGILLRTGAKQSMTYDSRMRARAMMSMRRGSRNIAAACVLLGLLAACTHFGVNANLDDLTLSSGSLVPVFAAHTTAYIAYLANATDSITVTPTTSDPSASCDVRVGGGSWADVPSGSPSSSLAMNVGTNTVDVRVTAEDGTTTKTYRISVERVGADVHIVPDDFTTIQAAIDGTADNDTVLVREGTYIENVAFPADRSITMRSTHGPDSTTLDGGSNGSPVVAFPASSEVSELDGFTITNGANAGGGGGIDIVQSSPAISNCILSGNSSQSGGGGIRCNGASPAISNCTFSANSAFLAIGFGSGGGMYNSNSSAPTLSNCTFVGNDAGGDKGGGMYNLSSSPALTDCTFSGNTAYTNGGGMCNESSSPTLTRCTFSENTANGLGGGMYNSSSVPAVERCSFFKNAVDSGQGSGMFNSLSSPILTSCLFYMNYNYGNNGQEMRNESGSSPTVTNCTFLSNADWAMYNNNSSPTVTNCILWGGIAEPIRNAGSSSPVVTYCDIQGLYAGTGNINADPMFADADNGNLHLLASSPCIDAGDNSAPSLPTTDIDGDDRRIDDPTVIDTGSGTAPIVDIGADEFSP